MTKKEFRKTLEGNFIYRVADSQVLIVVNRAGTHRDALKCCLVEKYPYGEYLLELNKIGLYEKCYAGKELPVRVELSILKMQFEDFKYKVKEVLVL